MVFRVWGTDTLSFVALQKGRDLGRNELSFTGSPTVDIVRGIRGEI